MLTSRVAAQAKYWRIQFAAAAIAGVILSTGSGSSFAQEKAVPKTSQPQETAKPQARAPLQQVVMPNAEKIVLLVRNTLLTLNNALQTGNFTVLRDTGAPGFREANSASRLSQAFSSLNADKLDLSAVAVITPQLTEAPILDQQKGMLRLKGYFPGKPVQIDFELLYQAVDGRWRLFGLSVQPNRSISSPPQAGEATTVTKKKGGSREAKP